VDSKRIRSPTSFLLLIVVGVSEDNLCLGLKYSLICSLVSLGIYRSISLVKYGWFSANYAVILLMGSFSSILVSKSRAFEGILE
jgi:hypothetical protein